MKNGRYVIAIDFGSTFTKIVIIDSVDRKIILTDKVPSSVNTDASISLKQCFELAEETIGSKHFNEAVKLASSSAAGGLRMTVIGLTDSLSTLAGKAAALGAGAKIIAKYSGALTEESASEIAESNTEIILMCGGYENGNVSMVHWNAEILAKSGIKAPVIYAGNTAVAKDVRMMMNIEGKNCYIVENIIPKQGSLCVDQVQNVIRSLFLERITAMKGLNVIKRYFDNQLIPTPAAVLNAGRCLSSGTGKNSGLGSLMIIDVGGATTDVYSFHENKSHPGARITGIPEPYAKRTVEGDLGMRETSGNVISGEYAAIVQNKLGLTEEILHDAVRMRMDDIAYLPDSEKQKEIDDAIAGLAVRIAARRHAGRIIPAYDRKCPDIQQGKNLTDVVKVIGTGGILVHNQNPGMILKMVEKREKEENVLLPENVSTYLDSEYVLYSAGLLSEIDDALAAEVMKQSIRRC